MSSVWQKDTPLFTERVFGRHDTHNENNSMIEAMLYLAEVSIIGGDYAFAKRTLKDLLKLEPYIWRTWYLLGWAHEGCKDYNVALVCLNRALSLREDDPNVYTRLGVVQRQRSRPIEAITAFITALDLNSDNFLANKNLGDIYKVQGTLDKALHHYEAASKACVRAVLKRLVDQRTGGIFKDKETRGSAWSEYFLKELVSHVKAEGFTSFLIPTSETANIMETTAMHGDLYWIEKETPEGREFLMLPNMINTAREYLRLNAQYSQTLTDQGDVLKAMGRHDEAERMFTEAWEFRGEGGLLTNANVLS
jgi:tetratricopeptide (TPR) repeat protein